MVGGESQRGFIGGLDRGRLVRSTGLPCKRALADIESRHHSHAEVELIMLWVDNY